MLKKFIITIIFLLIISFAYSQTQYSDSNLNEIFNNNPGSLSSQDIASNADSISRLKLENKLTADQLSENLDRFDPSKLNPQELSKAINNQYGTNHNFQNIPQGSNIKDGILTSSDNTINLKELKGSHNVDFKDGKVFVDGNEFNTAKNLGGDSSNNVKVGQASNVNTKNNFNFKNIKGGSFVFNQLGDLESAKFKTSDTEAKDNLKLEDGNGNAIVDFNIIDDNKESSINVEKQNDGSYKITTSNIESTYHGNGFNEYVFGETSEFYLDPIYGIYLAILDSPGIFRYESIDTKQSFAIQRKSGLSKYMVTIDKENHRKSLTGFNNENQNNQDSGYVTQFEKKIHLNGIINYLRFSDLDKSFHSTYESMDINNKADMNLDNSFIFINELLIGNINPTTNGIISFINNGKYAVYEQLKGNKVKRYGRYTKAVKPDFIKKYNSDFGRFNFNKINGVTPLVVFNAGIMEQTGFNSESTITKFRAVCKDCPQKEDFEKKMMERSSYYKIKQGICNEKRTDHIIF